MIDAYLHIPIYKHHQKYLRFTIEEIHYQFKCLLFGINTAPRVFSKILLATIAFMRLQGITTFHYLDDILLVAHSNKQLALQCDKVIAILSNFGWLKNSQKSNLISAQWMEYLCMVSDTQSGQILLPYRKVAKLNACAYRVMEAPTLSARDCMTM